MDLATIGVSFPIMHLDIVIEGGIMDLMLQCSKTCSIANHRGGRTMTAAAKINREPIIDEVQDNGGLREDATVLILRGMERIAELQKLCIDTAVQHSTDTVAVMKKAAEK